MLRKATNLDKTVLLSYLIEKIEECIYLYIDVANYDIESENCNVWIEEDDKGIKCVLMKYYDSYQIYSHIPGYEMNEIKKIIVDNPCKMISARRDIIEKLSTMLPGYKTTYGVIFDMNRAVKSVDDENVEWGKASDAEEIANLIQLDDDIGAHYTTEILKKQLADRIESGTGRSCILRKDGVIIAHTATYAEADKIAVISGTVVHPDYRNTDSFLKVTTALQSRLQAEGKKAYTFATNAKMIRYHRALHRVCGEYGKMEEENNE